MLANLILLPWWILDRGSLLVCRSAKFIAVQFTSNFEHLADSFHAFGQGTSLESS